MKLLSIPTLLATSASVLLLSGCFDSQTDLQLPGYIEADITAVASPVSGTMAQMAVKEGQSVQPGETLYVLESQQEQARLAEAQAKKAQADAQTQNLSKGARQAELESLRAKLRYAKAQLAQAESNLKKSESLLKKNFVSEAQVDNERTNVSLAQAQVEDARAALRAAKEGARSDERVAAAAQGIRTCAANLREKFPRAKLIVAMILPCHAPKVRFYEDILATNAEVAKLDLAKDPQIQVLDLTKDFLNADGTIRKELFTPDNIHLSLAGYEVYASRLKPLLEIAGAGDDCMIAIAVCNEQQPVRLDRAGNVDRFAIAGGEVERRIRRITGPLRVRNRHRHSKNCRHAQHGRPRNALQSSLD